MMQGQGNTSSKDYGEKTTTKNILHSPIEYMIDSLGTEQAENNILNSKPIDPELDDSEQLAGITGF